MVKSLIKLLVDTLSILVKNLTIVSNDDFKSYSEELVFEVIIVHVNVVIE